MACAVTDASRPDPAFFRHMEDVYFEPNTGCWLWPGPLSRYGYGKARRAGKQCPAHRESYREENGEIPDGMFVLHRCDVRCCVNPTHLYLGTHADNMRDMSMRFRHGLGKLNREQVVAIRNEVVSYDKSSLAELVSMSHFYAIKRGDIFRHL